MITHYNAKGYLLLVQAFVEGKQIQMFTSSGKWVDVVSIDTNRRLFDYRIKPSKRVIYEVTFSNKQSSSLVAGKFDSLADAKAMVAALERNSYEARITKFEEVGDVDS